MLTHTPVDLMILTLAILAFPVVFGTVAMVRVLREAPEAGGAQSGAASSEAAEAPPEGS